MSGIIDTVGSKSGIVGSDVYPAGHVLQTVSTNYTGQVTDSISEDTDTKIDEITAAITVKLGNDVQIQISAFGELSGTAAEVYVNGVVYRDSTVLKAPVVGNRTSVMTTDAGSNFDSNPYITPNVINILYTDKALAAGTYSYYLGIVTSSGGGTYYTNRSVNDTDSTIHTRGVSTVTLMEIQR